MSSFMHLSKWILGGGGHAYAMGPSDNTWVSDNSKAILSDIILTLQIEI